MNDADSLYARDIPAHYDVNEADICLVKPQAAAAIVNCILLRYTCEYGTSSRF
jgi:hypothetical protein